MTHTERTINRIKSDMRTLRERADSLKKRRDELEREEKILEDARKDMEKTLSYLLNASGQMSFSWEE